MHSGVKAMLASTGILVLVAGGELLYLHHRRAMDDAPPVSSEPARHTDPDNLVYLKRERPSTMKDEKALKGRTLWISAGGQMDYYPVHGRAIDFNHSQGTLLGAEPVMIEDAVEQPVPAKVALRMPRGDRQVLLLFTKPNNPQTYAVPVGVHQNGTYTFSTDDIFFYDDPRKLYADWGPQVWAAIDQHKVIPGMSERQSQMALGQVLTTGGRVEGDRTVDYDNNGHDVIVTYIGNKATKVDGPK